jgi:polyhydroxyalkanoate synthesis regulator phasin
MDYDKYDAMRQQLQQIIDIGFDYDGYHSSEDLKKLIDELVDMARKGLHGIRPFYIRYDKPSDETKYIEYIIDDAGNRKEVELTSEKITEYTKNFLKSV